MKTQKTKKEQEKINRYLLNLISKLQQINESTDKLLGEFAQVSHKTIQRLRKGKNCKFHSVLDIIHALFDMGDYSFRTDSLIKKLQEGFEKNEVLVVYKVSRKEAKKHPKDAILFGPKESIDE